MWIEIKGKRMKKDDAVMYKIILYVWTKVSQKRLLCKIYIC